MDSKTTTELEQSMAWIADTWPRFLRRFYEEGLAAGWDEQQAFYFTNKVFDRLVNKAEEDE